MNHTQVITPRGWQVQSGEMLPLLLRHEIQVLLRAGHTNADVAARTNVSLDSVRRVKAESEVTTTDDKGKSETRVVMKFHPRIAPIKAGVFPLLKNKPELVKKAQEVRDLLRPHMTVFYDDAGAIGRRYARQDEAGTPFGITIDFDTLGEKPELLDTVTLRYRDDGKQERLKISELRDWLLARVR